MTSSGALTTSSTPVSAALARAWAALAPQSLVTRMRGPASPRLMIPAKFSVCVLSAPMIPKFMQPLQGRASPPQRIAPRAGDSLG